MRSGLGLGDSSNGLVYNSVDPINRGRGMGPAKIMYPIVELDCYDSGIFSLLAS
jgi:hypothetical protein